MSKDVPMTVPEINKSDGTKSVLNESSFTMETQESSEASRNKALLRKIDWNLLPLMCTSYMLQFLDKQSLAQSSIMGFIHDLKLTGSEYSWSGSIFYIGYLFLSYPASMLMVRLPIGRYLACTFMIWGIILSFHAATHNFTGIMVIRFLLGAAEASVSPGFSLITGMWYKREEQPLRHGLWFAGNSIATAFGGLIAYGVAHIHGGLASWRWLFIIYGVITLIWAVVLFFSLPDSPTSARFLNDNGRREAVERIKSNQTGVKNSDINWNQVWEALTDYKIWILFFYQLVNNIPNGGLTTFTGLVMAGFGFSTLQVYLLTMPSGALHAIFSIGSTFLAGKFPNSRCLLTAGCTLTALIGCILVYTTEGKGSRLFGLFIFVAYAAGIPMTLSMVSSNVAGFTKKATVSAMMFIAYCVGNIIGPFLFFSREAPKYQSGFLAVMVCFAVAIVLILTLGFCWRWENTRRERLYGKPANTVLDSQEDDNSLPAVDLTDIENHSFRYIY